MTTTEEIRLVYQAAQDFYRHADAEDYNFTKRTSKTAKAMIEDYTKVLREWHEPEMITDEVISTRIRQTVIAILKIVHFKAD